MKTLNSIKILFLLIVFLAAITVTTLTIYFIQRENDINESYNINKLRTYTSSIVNAISEDFPNFDEVELEQLLEELKITALVSDLSNNILFNTTSFTTNDLVHDLYQDHTYSVNNEDMIKVSFPVKDNTSIVGVIIFEIPKSVISNDNYLSFYIALTLELLLIITSITYLILNYNKIVLAPIHQLDQALLDVSNGVYNKLSVNNGMSIRSFTSYNIMLEEMENMLSNQADYAKARKQMIANISHEIRTPLSYVKMSAEILAKEEQISSENKKHIEIIQNKITAIDNIIEDLFRYSKQDMDKLLVEPKEIYAKDMFDKIFNTIKLKEDSKHISLKISNNIANVLFSADENRLLQVVSNMVDNAEKHINEAGFIHIKTEIEENHIVLIIEDSGIGIESKDLPYIFEAFYQGTQSNIIRKKGAGLGLAICDYIIKKHDGEIFVYSEKGKGTKFVIKFPELK